MALGTEVVDLVWLHVLNDPGQVRAVCQIAVVQLEMSIVHMRVLIDVINPLSIEQGGAALDAMHLISFLQ